jgi:hypothetical protein
MSPGRSRQGRRAHPAGLSNAAAKADNRSMLSRRTGLLLTLAAIISSMPLWAAKDFVPPRAENANTYQCKDAHPTEKVTAAIDLYNAPPKDNIFITPYSEDGILPVLLVITNEGDRPITISSMQAQLVNARRSKMDSLSTDDVFRRVAHVSASSTSPPARVGPIPLSGNKSKKAQKQYEEIQAANFAAQAVEPHTTKSGFLFFDVQGVKEPIEGAKIFLTGVRDAGGNELMYFEIPVTPSTAGQ